jgi:hypothetical protein
MKSPLLGSFLWRISQAVRRLVFVMAALLTLVALFYLVENWRGRRAWEKYKAELTSQGERLNQSDYALAPVPADQNFAETPVLQAIAHKSQMDTNVWARFQSIRGVQAYSPFSDGQVDKENAADILAAFHEVEPELAELRAAAKRPYAQFTKNHPNAFLADAPSLVALRKISQLLTVHSLAELASGHSDRALADIEVVHRVADSLSGQSTLVMAMIRVAILGLPLHVFEEGLSTGAWSDQELVTLQKYFESVELLAGLDAAMRGGERNGGARLVEDLPRRQLADTLSTSDAKNLKAYAFKLAMVWCPRGWLFQNAVNYSRMMQKSFEAYDVRAQRVFPAKCDEVNTFLQEQLQVITPFKYLASVAVPNITKATLVTAQQQTCLREAALACALERYLRAHGEYPETLAALVPQFIAKLPSDLMTGEALKYQRVDTNLFSLYSVGWNLKDDGGRRTRDRTAGDWVWPPAR